MTKYPQHEIGKLMPRMSPEDYVKLKASIAANGFDKRNPVILYEGRILDGFHRMNACYELNIEPTFVQFIDLYKDEFIGPYSYVYKENEARRHTTMSQRAFIAIKFMPELEREAKERMRFVGKSGMYCDTQAVTESIRRDVETQALTEKIPYVQERDKIIKGEARKLASEKFKVNEHYITDAKRITETHPDLAQKCESGEMSISEAKREIKKKKYAERVEIAKANPQSNDFKGPFDVVLADPPWTYDFVETENRAIENQYKTLTVDQIIKQKPNVSADCVLFLWATAPKLLEALEVLKGWNFEYVTHAIWDKRKIGMGYWFRGQHELLLVGTRGKPGVPIAEDRVSSIFSESRTEHSVKPQCVYQWIDKAFPGKMKLEMYSRLPRPTWSSFGNEI